MSRFLHAVVLFMPLAILVGCWTAEKPPSVMELERGREAVTTALEAWQQGKVQELTGRTPPIRFVDDDLVEGCQLISFSLEELNQPNSSINDVRVMLDLRNPQGRTVSRKATYQVSLEPKIAVLRADY